MNIGCSHQKRCQCDQRHNQKENLQPAAAAR